MKKMRMVTLLFWVALIFCSFFSIGGMEQANADFVVNNDYSGWYSSTGEHPFANENYASGTNGFGTMYSDFFVFNLSGVSGPVSGATFNVYSYNIIISGTYTVYTTSLDPSIENDAVGRTDIYAGLTSGTPIGAINVDPADSNSWLSIPLNAAGLSWLQANEGQSIVLGGSFPQPIPSPPIDEADIFGDSTFNVNNNLTINTAAVPEPTTMLLLGSGLIGLVGYGRKRLFKK